MEKNECVEVEFVVEAVKQVVDCVGSSTPVMGCSIEVVEENIVGKVDLQVEGDTEGHKAK